MIQSRHLKSLGLVIDSDIIHPKVKKDLILIYETLSKDIKEDLNKNITLGYSNVNNDDYNN